MKRFLFAPLALAALLCSTVAASAAPAGPGPHHRPTPREQARFEAHPRRAPRPQWHRPVPPPLPPSRYAAPRHYR